METEQRQSWRGKLISEFPTLLGYLIFLGPIYYFLVWRLLPFVGSAKIVAAMVIAVILLSVTLFLLITEERLLKQLRNLLLFFLIVLGAPIVSIYFTSGDRSLIFKFFVVGYFSFLPAWIYLQFISIRGRTLWDEYVLNLYRLHVDHYAYLPEPPHYTFYYDLWRKIREALSDTSDFKDNNIYTMKFESLYGAISTGTDKVFKFRGENLFPVAIATVIISVGWVLVVEPQSIFGISLFPQAAQAGTEINLAESGPQIPFETFRFAILGAYFYVLQMLVRRYFQNDLKTSAYLNATMRFIVVLLLVWVMDILLETQVQASYRHAFAFIIGVFPSIGWEAIVALIKLPLKVVVPSLRQQYPLSELDGLNIWYESRLLEEGIEDMQNLATANLVDLMLNTRIPIERLIDWIDQSILYLHLGPTKDRISHNRDRLRQIGVRTATDLDDLFDSDNDELVQQLEAILNNEDNIPSSANNHNPALKPTPIMLRAIHTTLRNEPNIYQVREWKRYTEHHIAKANFSDLKDQVDTLKKEIGDLRSESGSTETTIKFINKTDQKIKVNWVDYNGNEISYATLNPGDSHDQQTYVTHPWAIRYEANDELITTVTATKDRKVLEITEGMA